MSQIAFSPESCEQLKKMLKDGFIYQRLKHSCGYLGNCYHQEDGKWERRTHCPQCKIHLTIN